MGYPAGLRINQPRVWNEREVGIPGRRLGPGRGHDPWEEEQVNTRTIAIAALVIAVIILLIFLL